MNFLYPSNRALDALFFGFAAGYSLMKAYFPFTARKSDQRLSYGTALTRLFVCFAGTAAIYFGLGRVFPGSDSSLYGIFRFIHCALTGFWVSAGAPWALRRLTAQLRTGVP
jgi:hypothetical protein